MFSRGVAASRFLGRQDLVACQVLVLTLGLITVSSSVMQFCNLLLFRSQEPGVKSWAEPLPRLVEQANVISVFVMRGRARKAWGLRIAIFIIIVFDPSNP